MPRLILLLAVAAVLYLMFRRVQTVPPHKRRAEYIKLGLAVAAAIVVVLTITGRMHWLGIAATGLLVALRGLLPTLVRLFPLLASRMTQGASAQGQGQSSTVETAVLRMQLAHDSGDLQGEVLKGEYAGWRLADMDRQQLEALMVYCRNEDADSARLLDSYLQQRFPGEGPFGQAQGNNDSGRQYEPARSARYSGPGRGRHRGRDCQCPPQADPETAPGPGWQRLPRGQDQPGERRPTALNVSRSVARLVKTGLASAGQRLHKCLKLRPLFPGQLYLYD